MHVPDGFINGATSASAAAVAAAGVGVALRRVSGRLLNESLALAGLTAAFVFAAQMINFPVAAGTSGHLLGGALAAILIGPAAAIVIMAAVMVIQSLLFADGGLTALGINVLDMALLAPITAWVFFRASMALAGGRRAAVVPAAAVAAWSSVVVASVGFTVLFAIGGRGDVDPDTVLIAMVGVHGVIGIGEALITVVVVRAVLMSRPDLVFGARTASRTALPETRRRMGVRFAVVAVAVTLLAAVGLSQFSSESPDGLERVAADQGFAETAVDHPMGNQPLADYGDGFDDGTAGVATSGIVGAVAVLIGAVGLLKGAGALRRRRVDRRSKIGASYAPGQAEG